MLGDKCPAAPLHCVVRVYPNARESTADLTSSVVLSLLPLPSATVSLLVCKWSSRVWAAPPELMCATEMFPLASATDPLLLSNKQHTKDKIKAI